MKLTVMGQHEDGEIYVEHVEADDVAGAVNAAIAIDYDRYNAEVLCVLKGHVAELDPDFGLGWPCDLPGVKEPSIAR